MNIEMERKIDKILEMPITKLAQKLGCREDQICKGDYIARHTSDTVCPYKVILGFANFEGSDVEDLGELEIVFGKKIDERNMEDQANYLAISFVNSKIKSTGKLRKVYGSIFLGENITSLGNIEYLGSNLYIKNTLHSFGNLKEIDGSLQFLNDKIESFENIERVGGWIFINSSSLKSLGALKSFRHIELSKEMKDRKNELEDLIEKKHTLQDRLNALSKKNLNIHGFPIVSEVERKELAFELNERIKNTLKKIEQYKLHQDVINMLKRECCEHSGKFYKKEVKKISDSND